MSLVQLQFKTDVRETLNSVQEIAENLDGVIVMGLRKDGQQMLLSSTMNGMQKAFLVGFANAWMASWFGLGNTNDNRPG